MKQTPTFIGMLRGAALALLASAAVAFAAQTPDSASISKVFDQAKDHAALAIEDASFLDANRYSNMSPQTHALYLQKVRGHAVELFRDYYLLQTLRDKGTPQQREAIDRLDPLLREVASSLLNTMLTYRQNPTHVSMPPYRDQVHSDWLTINAVHQHLCKCANKNNLI